MKTFRNVSNQRSYSIGLHVSTIYDSHKYSLHICYGYKSISWVWKKNPSRPVQETVSEMIGKNGR